MTIFTCEDSLESILTCIYDAWASGLGHKNICLKIEPIGDMELFCNYQHVNSDSNKAESVTRSIIDKISVYAYQMVYRCAMSTCVEKADIIYRFLLLGFHYGQSITNMLQLPAVTAIFEINRKVGNEAHYHLEFIRFEQNRGNVLSAHIEPKSNILSFIAPHFADRMPSEDWLIIDDNRKNAVIHPADQEYYFTTLTNDEFLRLKDQEIIDDPFIDLWEEFFHTIAIKERKNPICQRNLMPLWYRKHLTEFKSS